MGIREDFLEEVTFDLVLKQLTGFMNMETDVSTVQCRSDLQDSIFFCSLFIFQTLLGARRLLPAFLI